MPNKVKDLTSCRFGRLRVMSLENIRNGHAYWNCKCSCRGTLPGSKPHGLVTVRGQKLTSGRIVSCGCQRADPRIRRAAAHVRYAKKAS